MWRLHSPCAVGGLQPVRGLVRRVVVRVGAVLVALSASTATAGEEPACVVARVSDGDSLRCADGRKLRLLLVDAPELRQAPFGARAADELRRLAPTGTVLRLESDVVARDQYRRVLAYAFLGDGRMLNEELARAGFAVPLTYPPNVRHVERSQRAVDAARQARRGLWATTAFECTPKDFRARRCR